MASEMKAPVREEPYAGHQCCCDIENGNRCETMIHQPDQPVCDECLGTEHPSNPTFRMVLEAGSNR